MAHQSKRLREIAKRFEATKVYSIAEAIDILQKCPPVKFDQTVDLSLHLGVDPRKSDQNVRGTVSLPNGTGKTLKVLVFARGDKVKEALDAGADYAGHDELVEKVSAGWVDIDVIIATPEMMRDVGKLGKVLGPRGLMPTPKAGTVTTDVAKAVKESKAGKIEFKQDRQGVINTGVGKLSFAKDKLAENIIAFLQAVMRAKPPTAKGQYLKSIVLSSTMGPGITIEYRDADSEGG